MYAHTADHHIQKQRDSDSDSDSDSDFNSNSREIANLTEIEQSKTLKKLQNEPTKGGICFFIICSAALKGDWKAAEELLKKDCTLIKAPITEGGETALHIATMQGHASFVSSLLQKMEESDVEIQNNRGCTALSFAAAAGHIDIARKMVEKNPRLPTIRGGDGVTPLFMAALQSHSDTADYLFPLSGFVEFWTPEDQIKLLTTSIESGLYGLATSLVNKNNKLAVVEDSNGETPLEVLARKPLAFGGNSQPGLLGSIASKLPPLQESKPHKISASCNAYTLFDCLWDGIIRQQGIETGQVDKKTSKLLFIAAESGNYNFLVELIRRCPDFLYKVNDSKHSIFHIAVCYRYVHIFNLIYELVGVKDLISTYIDNDGNNMLHLAAKLAPKNQLNDIPGPALQMQREVLWYREVEKIVQPLYRNVRNLRGQTPYDLFLVEHENLMKEGEKQMKQTAKSCMLVTMLIAAVVFTAAFTVLGGYENNNIGALILENERLFVILPISETVATLSLLTSMLMFLSILTSRYAENDFLTSLPFCLVIGIMALFVSIVAMEAFLISLLFYQHGLAAIMVLLVFFTIVPSTFMKYQLLVNMLRYTYGCRWLFRSSSQLFSSVSEFVLQRNY